MLGDGTLASIDFHFARLNNVRYVNFAREATIIEKIENPND